MMHIDGACHCGRVTFTAQIDPQKVMICHCTDCQTLSGSPFRTIVPAPSESFKLVGETKSYVKVAESGNPRAQVFCPHCATPLYATSVDGQAPLVMLRLGCVKQRAQLRPVLQLWQRSAAPWVAELLAGIPGVATQLATHPGTASAANRDARED